MAKITAVIIDDEAPARDVIKTYLKEHPEIEVVAECSNGFEGLKAVQDLKPDMVFLDIQIPKITGFEMLELMEVQPVIVFVTAYDRYALKAFEASAADFCSSHFRASVSRKRSTGRGSSSKTGHSMAKSSRNFKVTGNSRNTCSGWSSRRARRS